MKIVHNVTLVVEEDMGTMDADRNIPEADMALEAEVVAAKAVAKVVVVVETTMITKITKPKR
jgi:hypothetical protein